VALCAHRYELDQFERASTLVFRQCLPLDERWSFATDATRDTHARVARHVRRHPHPNFTRLPPIVDLEAVGTTHHPTTGIMDCP
jgi:hypothetical protein